MTSKAQANHHGRPSRFDEKKVAEVETGLPTFHLSSPPRRLFDSTNTWERKVIAHLCRLVTYLNQWQSVYMYTSLSVFQIAFHVWAVTKK